MDNNNITVRFDKQPNGDIVMTTTEYEYPPKPVRMLRWYDITNTVGGWVGFYLLGRWSGWNPYILAAGLVMAFHIADSRKHKLTKPYAAYMLLNLVGSLAILAAIITLFLWR